MIQASDYTRLEKAATDNGFDIRRENDGEWMAFASAHCPLKIWLTKGMQETFIIALSDNSVAGQLNAFGMPTSMELPSGAKAVHAVETFVDLYPFLKRAFQLSRSLPSEPLKEYQKKIVGLPQSTEVERMVLQRVGQDIFRERLLEFWDGKCAVTGLCVPELLRASHIKPWKDCSNDAERLDVYNGLLLAPQYDVAFDRGLITFDDNGLILISKQLTPKDLKCLGIDIGVKIAGLALAHLRYLEWHRIKEFRQI